MTLPYPANLRLVVLDADIVDHPLEIAFHRDVSASLESGGILHPAQKAEMPNVSMMVAKSENLVLIVVVRSCDFIAEAALIETS